MSLTQEIRSCSHCKLRQTCHMPVPGEGNPNSGFWLIGEAPGKDEDQMGRPFVGRAGKILRKILTTLGIEESQSQCRNIYITNIIKCRPPNNKFMKTFANVCMKQFLWREIEIYKPAVVVLLGRNATTSVLPINLSFKDMLGQTYRFWHSPSILWCVTHHPASYLYSHKDQILLELTKHIRNFWRIYCDKLYINQHMARYGDR